MSLRIEAGEPTAEVVAKLLTIPNDKSITTIILAHQDYVILKEHQEVMDTILQVVTSTYTNNNNNDENRKWKKLMFEYSYQVFTSKEERKYEKDNSKFRSTLHTLGRKLQDALDLDQDDMALSGDSTRADSARVGSDTIGTEHTGYGSIVFKKNI